VGKVAPSLGSVGKKGNTSTAAGHCILKY
jgi:hypothetical protein